MPKTKLSREEKAAKRTRLCTYPQEMHCYRETCKNCPFNASKKRLHFKFYALWFDFWIGAYYNKKDKVLYVGYLPCLGVKFWKS